MVYRGHVQNGVVVFDQLPALPEGAEVQVAVVPPEGGSSTLGARLMKFAGKLEGLPSDLARNHDHYLHGAPKK
ncbi:MAG: hypothetical protein LLG00_08195 [Planctomycetaceae bacterium]|nr:hypothetical protein [Planctomycetaceae bacterium]